MRLGNKVIIYDLDGTLVDSLPGIAQSFRYTLQELNQPDPSDEDIRLAIGPGLHRTLEIMLGTSEKHSIDKAVKIYRQYYDSTGYKATTFYPGIKAMLEDVRRAEMPQFVASMKSDTIVRPILEYLDSLPLFVETIGANPEGLTTTKSEMLEALAEKHGFSLADSILVGDTAHDARAAREAGVAFYGVTFGYGTRAEMEEIGWEKIYGSVEELRAGLLEI